MPSNLKKHEQYLISFVMLLISILQMSPHPITVYHHLNLVSLNTKFQSEAPSGRRATYFTNSMCKTFLELENEINCQIA